MEQKQQIPTVHWITYTGEYTSLTIACNLWPPDRHTATRSRKETTCGNCKRTRAYLKEEKNVPKLSQDPTERMTALNHSMHQRHALEGKHS